LHCIRQITKYLKTRPAAKARLIVRRQTNIPEKVNKKKKGSKTNERTDVRLKVWGGHPASERDS